MPPRHKGRPEVKEKQKPNSKPETRDKTLLLLNSPGRSDI